MLAALSVVAVIACFCYSHMHCLDVALDNNSSLTRWISLNSSIPCSFSLLSGEFSKISNALLSISSSAVRHTQYCSGKYSVTYSLTAPWLDFSSQQYIGAKSLKPHIPQWGQTLNYHQWTVTPICHISSSRCCFIYIGLDQNSCS